MAATLQRRSETFSTPAHLVAEDGGSAVADRARADALVPVAIVLQSAFAWSVVQSPLSPVQAASAAQVQCACGAPSLMLAEA